MKLTTSSFVLVATTAQVWMTAATTDKQQTTTSIEKVHAAADKSIEMPDVFGRRDGGTMNCDNNAIIAAWCDNKILSELQCGILPEFDEYACSCPGDPSLCPTECIGGTEVVQKTHYGIRCMNIPTDSPNYILKERHAIHRCENNLVVSAWCDDYINRHLECGLYPTDDQYLCKCTGKATNCPDECINGAEPIVRTQNSVLCAGIPVDNPNYVLTEPLLNVA
jgi:hypothetical protein